MDLFLFCLMTIMLIKMAVLPALDWAIVQMMRKSYRRQQAGK